ncbi:MAG TPA: cell division protein FtsQ/DivIB [Burkholderiales bacterium]|nr:cell division protein FtsQ/DivIB [Burkholderiales bacterium]
MWDKPELLDRVANALFVLAFALAAAGALLFITRLPAFALHEVRIDNPLAHVTREQIEDVVRRDLAGNFFTLDLVRLRAGFERLPWVRRADVRRAWPDRVDVALEEQVPLARWGPPGDGALVNVEGEVFAATLDGALPVFVGPDAASAKEIAIQYDYFRRSLAAVNEVPAEVNVSSRRAWQLKLASGTTLELGRDDIEARLDRFVTVYARSVGHLPRRPDYVDLRYPNGFAARMPG